MTNCSTCGDTCGQIFANLIAHQAARRAETIDWGSLRRLKPLSDVWGIDRGLPIDRHYIHNFLEKHRADIRGRALEVKDPLYTMMFGEAVESREIVDNVHDNPLATVFADLACPEALPAASFDCFILTQTIHINYDMEQIVANAHRALRSGGVLLASLPCVSRIDYEADVEGDFWRFTPASSKRLFERIFGVGNVEVSSFGNVLTCIAFLLGVAAEELNPNELEYADCYFPLVVCLRARKSD